MESTLWYRSEARVFEEALPLGNGAFGAMVYGGTENEKISLNLDTLWAGKPEYYGDWAEKPECYTNKNSAEAFEKARKLVLEDKAAEAEAVIAEPGTWYNMWPFSYLPMANLQIGRTGTDKAGYSRRLDLEKALCSANFGHTENEVFISNPDDVLVFSEKSRKPADVTIGLTCQLQHEMRFADGILILTGRCPTSNGTGWNLEELPFAYEKDAGITFTLAVKVECDGEMFFRNGALQLQNVSSYRIYAAAKSSYAGYGKPFDERHEEVCLAILEKAFRKGRKAIREDHILDHKALFNLTGLRLGRKNSDLPTDERLRSENCREDLGLVELLWAFGKYLTIAASRKGTEPTNLQGIWNELLHAAFWSAYALNINLQMNYWPTLMLGLDECYEPLISMVKKISQVGRKAAKEYYNADGFCTAASVDIWGKTSPTGGGHDYAMLYAFWNLGSGWIATHLFEYYEYTLDLEFLRDTAYDIMKEACKFYLSILSWQDGEYLLAPSTSPENRYLDEEGREHAFTKKAAMSQAIVKELFCDTLKAAEILGVDEEFRSNLKEKIEHIHPHVIGSDGRILEWDGEYREFEPQHRHVSHLYGLFPGNQITPEETPELAAAARKSLEVRGDEGTGWSRAWKINFWAKLKDGDRALKLVQNQLNFVEATGNRISENGGTYANMMDAHPPFQIDGNFGAAAGIMQMFLQYECGKIKILPALPTMCAEGEITGIKTKGNVAVSVAWENCAAKKVTLLSPVRQNVQLEVNGKTQSLTLKAGEACVLTY